MSDEETEVVVETSDENHPALVILSNLLESGQITQDVFNTMTFKFKKLHQAFTQSCSTEQILLRRTRELNKELKAQKNTIQNSATQQEEHRTALTALRQHVTNIQAELEATREQIEQTQANTKVKQKEADKLQDKVAKARDDKELKLEPLKRQVQIENTNLEQQIQFLQKQIESLKAEGQSLLNYIQADEEQLVELEKKKRAANQKMFEVGAQPNKTRAKANAVESSHNTMLTEEKTATNQCMQLEASLQTLHNQAHDLETENQHILNDIDGMVLATNDMKMKAEELKTKCAEQTNTKQQREFENRKIQKQITETNKEIAAIEAKLDVGSKDIVKKEKEAQKLEEAIANQILDKKALEGQLNTLNQDQQKEEENNKKMHAQYEKAMAASQAALQQIVQLEGVTAEMMADIKAAVQDKDRKQAIHDQLSKKEHEIERQLTEASLIRDRKAREMAAMKKKTVDAKIQAKEVNLDYLDLCRKQEMINQKLKEYSELYEKVKLDRNRYVNIIQTSKQLIVELKEKIRILDNEVEVLRKEFEDIDDEVKLKKAELDQAFKRRNSTKSELKNAQLRNQDLNQKIDFQQNETKRLERVLRSVETDIKLKHNDWKKQTASCQDKQRELIDSGDKMCILREQLNTHENILKNGEVALKEREEETKLLGLRLDDIQRRIDIMCRKVPQVRAYDNEIADLDKQLDRERKDVDVITRKLENPDEQARPRKYNGKDFTLQELDKKVATYEQRINEKGQQLWEKQILLDEINQKIEALQKDSQKDVSKQDKVFRKGGEMRAESMSLDRKYKAACAEMAYYEGMKQVLEQEKQDIVEERQMASERTTRGEAFDDTARKILQMHQRDIESKGMPRKKSEFDSDDDDDEDKKPVSRRYTAYRTSDAMLMPYGAFPAFAAAPPSGQLRHYRKETQRPIEL
ncbi:hypothetical protein TVAG_174030 [Trichomonas vaginalis G3]|uniref:Uncharacterized protein n=1 Tax=Trichomonas vaginalis (strain ATCC PRA-98 / G3) TaxID=412133 RepID=A2EWU6_TRIV3|nr:cilia- and flagella-associated protein 58-related family [Trichomonas vaginalis G3]EAY02861.1 hypothetical protein TVAG_174030 [Trichomonas vaginalis G3]KAI5497375.1 cilia- and flagella-associated protein 58-related family [Trichomonas vaginalis G3]|eukprot:XP_001315084.1 hypothetical protein [Trichomonas vaginalis G3]